MTRELFLPFVRTHAIVLSASWLLATAAALYAYSVAPPVLGAALPETLVRLQAAWPWYMLCYGLFVATDAALAVLGAVLLAWLGPQDRGRALAMAVLFALAGALGLVMDAGMLVAAQIFKSGVLLGDPRSAELVLIAVNAGTAWLSAASFVMAGSASWLVGPLAERAGAHPHWVLFTRGLACWQLMVSAIVAWAAISGSALAAGLALATGVIATPLLATVWLAGLVAEVRTPLRA